MAIPQIRFKAEKKKPPLCNAEFISANDFSISEEEKYKARIELSETEDKKSRYLQKLRDTLARDEDANYRTDDEYLLRYLRVRKYDLKRAYQNIRATYGFRRKYHETLSIPPNLESLLNLNFLYYLPYLDEHGRVLLVLDFEKWNWEETSFTEIMQLAHAVLDIISVNPRCQINGVTTIWNTKGINRHHLAAVLRVISIGSLSYFLQTYYPIRLKNVYAINSSQLTQMLYKLLRPFVSRKISERIFLLGSDLEELHEHINPALLPNVLGGSLEENQCNIAQNIIDNLSYIKYERSFN